MFSDGATNNNVNNSHTNNNVSRSHTNNKAKSPDIPPVHNNFNDIQHQLKKQLASDSRNRGPPPPAPVRNVSYMHSYVYLLLFYKCHLLFTLLIFNQQNAEESPKTLFINRNGSSNGIAQQQSSSALNLSNLQANTSTLHRKANSSVNISTTDGPPSPTINNQSAKPVIRHGKPNLAPKPPLNGKMYIDIE